MTTMQVFQGVEVVIENEEPMIRDVVLAEALGYSRPRDIRKLIKRFEKYLPGVSMRATVARIEKRVGNVVIGYEDRSATEYLLTEAHAIFIAAKSDTPRANQLLQKIIAAFLSARKFIQRLLLAPLDEAHRELEELRVMYREDMARRAAEPLSGVLEETVLALADRVERLEKVRSIKDAPLKRSSQAERAYNKAIDDVFGPPKK